MITHEQARNFLANIDSVLARADEPAMAAMRAIAEAFPHYKWVGIYWLKGEMLELGPYVGAPTEHDRIPVGRGVCGTAIVEGENQIIADVRQLTNYLACSLETRSEIVVLIRRGDQIIGQIDADGHEPGAFDETDEALLRSVAEQLT